MPRKVLALEMKDEQSSEGPARGLSEPEDDDGGGDKPLAMPLEEMTPRRRSKDNSTPVKYGKGFVSPPDQVACTSDRSLHVVNEEDAGRGTSLKGGLHSTVEESHSDVVFGP